VKAICLCPTFGRAPDYLHLVEEAVESFLRQDYTGERELIVLNDCPLQKLVCNVPNVRVVNLDRRFGSLGEKYNAMIELTADHGDVLLPWEDDDISLPWRISQAVKQLGTGSYWKPPQVWFKDSRGYHWNHAVGVRHHASIFTHDAWDRVGGYPRVSGNQDAVMDQYLGGAGLPRFPDGIPPNEWAYVYRWGVSPRHLSGNRDHHAAWIAEAYREVIPGTFELRPYWRTDYVGLTRNSLPSTADTASSKM